MVERRERWYASPVSRSSQALARAADPDALEWRIHFHVPLYAEYFGALGLHREDIRRTLRAQPATTHFEIETYTWSVLPEDLRVGLGESIGREYAWVLDETVRKTVVVNIVGLTPGLIGDSTPALAEFLRRGKAAAIQPAIPAVTCTAQATYLHRRLSRPSRHRGQRLVFPRRMRGAFLAPVEQAGGSAESLGAGARHRSRPSPAPICSAGTTCIRLWIIR